MWCARRLVVGLVLLLMAGAARAQDSLVVVELFTSQGCSSCPPANAVIGEVAKLDNVLAISQHVDYWDYIGWKDVFAIPQTTARQRAYARALSLRYVYTPQILVQGHHQLTGPNSARLLEVIAAVDPAAGPRITLSETAAGHLEIGVSAARRQGNGDVFIVTYDGHRQTLVSRGDNRGRTLDTYNVVRSIDTVGVWRGEPATFETSLKINELTGEFCAALLQDRDTLRILAAARLSQ